MQGLEFPVLHHHCGPPKLVYTINLATHPWS
uniref:Uncharacterized protein n=1 Tax=Arundo donax TaxID=35708 RepID=A0A0A8ZAP4_ARUDO